MLSTFTSAELTVCQYVSLKLLKYQYLVLEGLNGSSFGDVLHVIYQMLLVSRTFSCLSGVVNNALSVCVWIFLF